MQKKFFYSCNPFAHLRLKLKLYDPVDLLILIMDISFIGTWTNEIKEEIESWIKEKFIELKTDEEILPDLIEFVSQLVESQKEMKSIYAELKDILDGDENQAR